MHAVAVLALHDRDFFLRLIEDPRKALEEQIEAGRLEVDPKEIDRVVESVEEVDLTGVDLEEVWEEYHATGRTWPTDSFWLPWAPGGPRRAGGRHGSVAVGLLALRDRKFFAALVEDPRAALEARIERGDLELEADEVDRVVALIEDRNARPTASDHMELWDRYQATGSWNSTDWPTSRMW